MKNLDHIFSPISIKLAKHWPETQVSNTGPYNSTVCMSETCRPHGTSALALCREIYSKFLNNPFELSNDIDTDISVNGAMIDMDCVS